MWVSGTGMKSIPGKRNHSAEVWRWECIGDKEASVASGQ